MREPLHLTIETAVKLNQLGFSAPGVICGFRDEAVSAPPLISGSLG